MCSVDDVLLIEFGLLLEKLLSWGECNKVLQISVIVFFRLDPVLNLSHEMLPQQDMLVFLVKRINELSVNFTNNFQAIFASLDELFTQWSFVT